jgi:hypothetical protein
MNQFRVSLAFLFIVLFCSCNKSVPNGDELYGYVEKFVSLGEHRTTTPADTATSYWLKQKLDSLGFETHYLTFPVRQFFVNNASVLSDNNKIEAFPLWWANDSTLSEVSGSIADIRYSAGKQLKGKVALLNFPGHGGQTTPAIISRLDSLIGLGVAAIIAVTENETGQIVAYNTKKDQKPWKVPVVLIAPKDTLALQESARLSKTVVVSIKGEYRHVQARNVYGTIGHGNKYIVISTPISGWFTCGGERGPGIAVWLALAKWVAENKPSYTFVFTGNSGHELDFEGARQFLEKAAPAPGNTHLWIHFGAGVATVQWKSSAQGLKRTGTLDTLRHFFYNQAVAETFTQAFANTPAQKVLVKDNPGGELVLAARKGYPRFVSIANAHPFFHVPTDDASSTSPQILEETAQFFIHFLKLETSL